MDNDCAPETRALIRELTDHWARQGISPGAGAPVQQIESFESRYEVRFPPDLRAYFATVDGMAPEDETDSDMFSFLPLNAVKSIPEELAQYGGIPDDSRMFQFLVDKHRWFVIVDYLIRSAVFAIRLSAIPESTPVLCSHGGTRHWVVAPSFSGFLEAYLADPFELLFE